MSSEDIDSLLSEYYDIPQEVPSSRSSPVAELSSTDQLLNDIGFSHVTLIGDQMIKVMGMEKKREEKEYGNMDTVNFSIDDYLKHTIRNKNLDDISNHYAKIKSTVYEHEINMNKLVKLNYNKFISATSTIKELHKDVDKTNPDKDKLFTVIGEIETRSNNVTNNLLKHKTKVEQLVSIRRLLKKVEFLFELPARLHKAWELGDYAQAVKVYHVAQKIWKNHSSIASIKSFEAIAIESENIMKQLTSNLRSSLKDSKMGSIAILESATLLLELGVKIEDIWKDMLDSRKTKFTNDIQKSVTVFNQQNRANRSASSDNADSRSVAGVNEDGRSALLQILYQYFLVEFFEFLEQFFTLFMGKKELRDVISPELHKFVRVLFNEYFNITSGALKSSAQSALSNKRKEPFGGFMEDLTFFYQHVEKLGKLLSDSRIADRASEIIEKSIRDAIEWLFVQTQESIALELVKLYDKVVALEVPVPPKQFSDQIEMDQIAQLRQELAISPCNSIILLINSALMSLVPLLDQKKIFYETSWIAPLIHEHFRITLFSFTSLVLQDTIRLSEGYVHSVRSTLASQANSIFVRSVSTNCFLYYLSLSQLCLHMHQKGVGTCLAFLHDSFSVPGGEDKEENERSVMLYDMKEASQLLVRRYSELNGYELARIITSKWEHINWSSTNPPNGIHSTVNEFWRAVQRIEAELAKVFPKNDNNSKVTKLNDLENSLSSSLFRERIQIVGPLASNRTSPLVGIYKIVFKAVLEKSRNFTFSLNGLSQFHLNVMALHSLIPTHLSGDDRRTLQYLLEDVIKNSNSRCIEQPDHLANKQLVSKIKMTSEGVFYEP